MNLKFMTKAIFITASLIIAAFIAGSIYLASLAIESLPSKEEAAKSIGKFKADIEKGYKGE